MAHQNIYGHALVVIQSFHISYILFFLILRRIVLKILFFFHFSIEQHYGERRL